MCSGAIGEAADGAGHGGRPSGCYAHGGSGGQAFDGTVSLSDGFLCVVLCVQEQPEKLQMVLDTVVAHQGATRAADLVARLLAALVEPSPDNFRPLLRRIAALNGS